MKSVNFAFVRNRHFGPWRAVEEIGRGGMGIVLRGKRADGKFEKTVAIKLLPGSSAPLAEGRLTEEIRILARLEHPGEGTGSVMSSEFTFENADLVV